MTFYGPHVLAKPDPIIPCGSFRPDQLKCHCAERTIIKYYINSNNNNNNNNDDNYYYLLSLV